MGELRSKYGNHRLWIDGKRFDSQAEATRFRELQLLERAGEIEVLLHHPRFALVVNGVKIGTYEADAGYIDHGAEYGSPSLNPASVQRAHSVQRSRK